VHQAALKLTLCFSFKTQKVLKEKRELILEYFSVSDPLLSTGLNKVVAGGGLSMVHHSHTSEF
jgi:hypothetical protein